MGHAPRKNHKYNTVVKHSSGPLGLALATDNCSGLEHPNIHLWEGWRVEVGSYQQRPPTGRASVLVVDRTAAADRGTSGKVRRV